MQVNIATGVNDAGDIKTRALSEQEARIALGKRLLPPEDFRPDMAALPFEQRFRGEERTRARLFIQHLHSQRLLPCSLSAAAMAVAAALTTDSD